MASAGRPPAAMMATATHPPKAICGRSAAGSSSLSSRDGVLRQRTRSGRRDERPRPPGPRQRRGSADVTRSTSRRAFRAYWGHTAHNLGAASGYADAHGSSRVGVCFHGVSSCTEPRRTCVEEPRTEEVPQRRITDRERGLGRRPAALGGSTRRSALGPCSGLRCWRAWSRTRNRGCGRLSGTRDEAPPARS